MYSRELLHRHKPHLLQDCLCDGLSVGIRKRLDDGHIVQVVIHQPSSEESEVLVSAVGSLFLQGGEGVGDLLLPARRLILTDELGDLLLTRLHRGINCSLLVPICHLKAQLPTTGMDHQPQAASLVPVDLDEVVAAAKCANATKRPALVYGVAA